MKTYFESVKERWVIHTNRLNCRCRCAVVVIILVALNVVECAVFNIDIDILDNDARLRFAAQLHEFLHVLD